MKKNKLKIPQKRVARSEVIIDGDDFLIMYYLHKSPYTELQEIKKLTNLSDKAISIHLGRLLDHNLIIVLRDKIKYKFKIIGLTEEGYKIKQELMRSPLLTSKINKLLL